MGVSLRCIEALAVMAMTLSAYAQTDTSRPIWFGTKLKPNAVVSAAQQLAKSLANPSSPQWRAKGDVRRTYRFAEANRDIPYRLCVPASWNGSSKLPLMMYLHGAGSDENTYLDMNNKQMVNLAAQYGFLLVSPLGDQGAYGNFLRLTAPFGDSAAAAGLMAAVTPASDRTNELSEKDVINVLELVLNEYPIDTQAMFLAGHSMGSGGTWYIGGKYARYWRALAPMSGPFVQASGYPWDTVGRIPVFITEGIQTPSLDASRKLRDWMQQKKYALKYKEVNADHGGMIPLTLPDVFKFFDSCRTHAVAVDAMPVHTAVFSSFSARYHRAQSSLYLSFPSQLSSCACPKVVVSDLRGRVCYCGAVRVAYGEARIHGITLSAGLYHAWIRTEAGNDLVSFTTVP